MDFDETMRARAKEEGWPIPPDYDDRLRGVLDALPDAPTARRGARPLKTLLLAAAVCAALCLSALALSPALRDSLAGLLGSFAPYSSAVEGISAIDNGIRVRVLSTLADQNDGTAYLEVTDLKGGRLDGSTVYNGYTRDRLCTAYDEETRTALFSYKLGNGNRNEDGTATVSISRFLCGMKPFEGVALPWDLLTDQKLESMIPEEEPEHLVLTPNQTPAKLSTDYFTLSSMGFDSNGVFHLQVALNDGVWLEDESDIFFDLDLDWEWNSLSEIDITFGEGKYVDYSFPDLTVERFGQFRLGDLRGRVYTGANVEGEWELTFPLEVLPERTVTTDENLYETNLKTFAISTMSIRMETFYNGPEQTSYFGPFPLAVFLEDGTVLHFEYCRDSRWLYRKSDGSIVDSHSGLADGEKVEFCGAAYRYSFPQAVDPANVIAVALGQRYIPFDGNTAGEGSWLPEFP